MAVQISLKNKKIKINLFSYNVSRKYKDCRPKPENTTTPSIGNFGSYLSSINGILVIMVLTIAFCSKKLDFILDLAQLGFNIVAIIGSLQFNLGDINISAGEGKSVLRDFRKFSKATSLS